ncbi:unnamed protein product [Macrosiphum euphorbiae]|uniref:Uncharacterized protein n=1 Tax=Macrosiphum euphorbiae TaxID=13131 RepID=A0AAV0X4I6_9HEMI|nr:unnamed protein product [Macrosiphum euphorbiae]
MYICSSILGWIYITDDEARLILNVINQELNNFTFGKERFLAGENYIVSLKDVHEFYTFINVCYYRLLCKNKKGQDKKCGFIQIDNFESIVPYCIIDNQKYVPLFYFKKEKQNLIDRAIKIKDWNLAYLKFCWKVQGIRDELFAGSSCTVVSVDNIKKYFPPETHFEDFWPHETLNSYFPINQNSSTHLKFNCKMQCIRDELFAGDSCTVASVDNIKKYFPPETHFEDFWPHETLSSHFPINQNSSTHLKFRCKTQGIIDELFAGNSCTVASVENIKKYFPPETHFEDCDWPDHTPSHSKMDFRKNTVKKCRNESINGRLFWKAIVELVPSTPSVTQLLNIYLKYVHLDMYICSSILGWIYITDDEARLILNVINQEHSNFTFGKERFLAGEDYIVSLKDVYEFYTFINVCYNRLLCINKKGQDEKCGFIQINNFESIVPYCIIDNQKYVPLFYFKKEKQHLIDRAIKIKDWNLAYLRFCWKVQGIKDELIAGSYCTVVSVDNIKKYFPPETHFEDFWPHETLNSHFPINQNSSTHLKFRCKMQGIRDELFAGDSCTVASVDNIKKYFPPETHFEDYWPNETLNSHLPINQNSSTHVNLQGALPQAPPQAEPAEFIEDPVTGCGCSDEEMELTVIAVLLHYTVYYISSVDVNPEHFMIL